MGHLADLPERVTYVRRKGFADVFFTMVETLFGVAEHLPEGAPWGPEVRAALTSSVEELKKEIARAVEQDERLEEIMAGRHREE